MIGTVFHIILLLHVNMSSVYLSHTHQTHTHTLSLSLSLSFPNLIIEKKYTLRLFHNACTWAYHLNYNINRFRQQNAFITHSSINSSFDASPIYVHNSN